MQNMPVLTRDRNGTNVLDFTDTKTLKENWTIDLRSESFLEIFCQDFRMNAPYNCLKF